MWRVQRNNNGHLVLLRDGRPTISLNKAPGCDSLPTAEAKKNFALQVAKAMNTLEQEELTPDRAENESSPDVVPFFWLPVLVFIGTLLGAVFGAWVVS